MSSPARFGKFGHELADALEEAAGTDGLTHGGLLEILDIELPEHARAELEALPPPDSEQLRQAADAIRVGSIPVLWPWIWFIPWIMYVPEGETSA